MKRAWLLVIALAGCTGQVQGQGPGLAGPAQLSGRA